MRNLAVLASLAAALATFAAEPVVRPASNTDPSASLGAGREGKVGERPYEMVWAKREPA